ncbi:VOC family protein [Pallidibacillus pasinlerensis]|uniref:Glyoxalase n=1 Tax=Pallidibacillus pasinlerensis TaxID=2703818 RepID=A0ABX0A3P0_9BACI|nr:VOC family protein [Pallidibacillus pasinlerensis]NCU17447.1 glyoxalase [Pallidibacillus pasinlerensis]
MKILKITVLKYIEKDDFVVPQRLSLVTIGCFDFLLLRKFYQDLGWEETDNGYTDYAVFKTVGVLLSLYSVEKLAEGTGLDVQKSTKFFKGITFAINVDKPSQVDETIEAVRSIGGKIISEPNDGKGD